MTLSNIKKIGRLASQFSISQRTLRFYEEEGLITPARSELGTRQYNEENVQRLQAVMMLSRLAIPIAEIKAFAQARPISQTGDEASHRVDELLDTLEQNLQQKRQQLEQLATEIAATRSVVRQCFGCTKPPTRQGCRACPVDSERRQITLLNLIWDEEKDAPR